MTDLLDDLARHTVPEDMGQARIATEDFIRLYNAGEAELLDIRVPAETAVWQLNFGLRIPANELPERLGELPREAAGRRLPDDRPFEHGAQLPGGPGLR